MIRQGVYLSMLPRDLDSQARPLSVLGRFVIGKTFSKTAEWPSYLKALRYLTFTNILDHKTNLSELEKTFTPVSSVSEDQLNWADS